MSTEVNVEKMLEELTGPDFYVKVGPANSATSLRRHLPRTTTISALRDAFEGKALTESTVRDWTEHLLRDFVPRQLFAHDLAIAAMIVVVERVRSDFTDEFLYDLARLEIAEMPLSSAVARLAIHSRLQRPRSKRQEDSFSSNHGSRSAWRIVKNRRSRMGNNVRLEEENWENDAAA